MKRQLPLGLAAALLAVAVTNPTSWGQDGPIRRAGRALDNAGKNIRNRVETEVARGEVSAFERDLLARVHNRIRWDKQLVNSVLQVEVHPDGATILRGSVLSDAAKKRAVDLASSTVGVTSVVDELAVSKTVRVIEAAPVKPVRVIRTPPPVVVPPETKVVVPAEPEPLPKP